MAVVAPVGAPTRVDAEAAAEVLIAAGAAEVLLFGSVARGDAGADSDIDLVAIFADLDYAERAVRQRTLQAAAGAAVPWPVQVHVTDRPEWRARVERVATSFEHRIAAASVPLAGADEAPVDWGKEMVLPMSDPQEALRLFNHWTMRRLRLVDAATRPGVDETHLNLPADVRTEARLDRLVDLCTAAALTAETSLKVLATLYGEPTPTTKDLKTNGHRIAAGLKRLLDRHVPEPARTAAAAVFDRSGVDIYELSTWREKDAYPANLETVREDAVRLAATYALVATEIVAVTISHLHQEISSDSTLTATVATANRYTQRITAALDILGGPPQPGDLAV